MLTTLGLFGKGMVVVPDLSTLSYTNASTTLQSLGLIPAVISTPITTQTSNLDQKVATQSIPGGTAVDYDTVVSIQYYSYSAPAFTVFGFTPDPTPTPPGPTPTPPGPTPTPPVDNSCCQDDDAGYCVNVDADGYGTWYQYQYDPCTATSCPPRNMGRTFCGLPELTYCPSLGYSVAASGFPQNCPGAETPTPPAPTFSVFAFTPTTPTPCYSDEIPSGTSYRAECCGMAVRVKVIGCSGTQIGIAYYCIDSCEVPAFSVFSFAPTFSVFSFTPAGFSVFGFITGFSVFSFTPTGGGGGCLVYGTPILLADRTYKNIEDLVIGDELLSLSVSSIPDEENPSYLDSWTSNNLDDATFTTTAVTNIIKSTWEGYYLLNNKLKVTYEHTMLVKRDDLWKFTQMENVVVGDYVVDSEGDTILVTSIQYVNSPVETVSIDTEVKDLYFANDILVHNMYAAK
jgi:hypothetical protein